MNFCYEHFDTIDSTNDYIKSLAKKGQNEGCVAIADTQTKGKGRKGRSFFSDEFGNLYLSLLLRPQIRVEDCLRITTMAAVCISDAIDELFSVKTGIKWVNDIFLNDKKICGILTEAELSEENNGKIDFAVLGIGVNLFMPRDGYPDEIREIAGAVFDYDFDVSMEEKASKRDMLADSILSKFDEMYTNIGTFQYMDRYREKSFLIGRDVYYLSGEERVVVRVLDIDDDAALVVVDSDGKKRILNSGEISVGFK